MDEHSYKKVTKRGILPPKNSKRIALLQSGFTLIELLIVIVIITALAIAVFAALNPTKRLVDARNARRITYIDSIRTAINQYMIDQGALPGIPNDGVIRQIGTGAGLSSCALTTAVCTVTATNCVELTTPLASYLKTIPQDPKIGSSSATGYTVSADSSNNITVNGCGIETLALTNTPTPTLTPTPTPTGNLWYVSKNGTNADGKSWATAWNDLNKIIWSNKGIAPILT